MTTLVTKMTKYKLLTVELILGTLLMLAGIIVLPGSIIAYDAELLLNPYVFGVVLIGMLFFGLVGFFAYVRPFIIYKRLPKVLAEADDKYLYIHTKKEAKIPLEALLNAYISVSYPFIFDKEVIYEIIVHIFSEEYGNVILEIPDFGTYKLRFVSHAADAVDELNRFINKLSTRKINDEE